MNNRLLFSIIFAVAAVSGYFFSGAAMKKIENKDSSIQTATLAGGCFWSMQPPFQKIPGIRKVIAGYQGGKGEAPTYEDYAQKGYIEVVKIFFDPSIISYENILNIFWHQIDPTDAGGQFVDRGPQYRSAIFYNSEVQRRLAQQSKKDLEESQQFSKPIVTELIPDSRFYPAEEYHQDYPTKNPIKYHAYKSHSGRDAFLTKAWSTPRKRVKKLSEQELRAKLTPIQYEVTQQNGTETPFKNEYWNNEEPGIYVDIVSGEPLFSSLDKYDSKTGWPSFKKPLEPNNIVEKEDIGLINTRIEIRSKHGNSHLGHVFNDGPAPTGLRYCMNSAALRFVPVQDLEKENLSQYKKLFENLNDKK